MVFGFRFNLRGWPRYGTISAFNPMPYCIDIFKADLGSAMPTSGGLYWWTHFFSPPKTRNPLCFLVGYSNTLGLVAGFCSIDCEDYGFESASKALAND